MLQEQTKQRPRRLEKEVRTQAPKEDGVWVSSSKLYSSHSHAFPTFKKIPSSFLEGSDRFPLPSFLLRLCLSNRSTRQKLFTSAVQDWALKTCESNSCGTRPIPKQ